MRARRGPRPARDPADERRKIENRPLEVWVDEGSLREEAQAATDRAADGRRPRRSPRQAVALDPSVERQIRELIPARRADRTISRVREAADALAAERFGDARRVARSLLDELAPVATVHRVVGLAAYGLGRWKEAAAELSAAEELEHSVEHLPVLADAYRALERWPRVDEIWARVRAESPAHEVMAEARIVAASAAADRGDLPGAIAIMDAGSATSVKGRVHDHHLRQWYVLADLHDRAGDPIAATRLFSKVVEHDPAFVDVRARLDALGR